MTPTASAFAPATAETADIASTPTFAGLQADTFALPHENLPERSDRQPFADDCERTKVSHTALPLTDPDFLRICKGMTFLSLYHGFARPNDGIEHFLVLYGANLETYDLEISDSHDLADDGIWSQIRDKLESGFFAGGGGGAPCSTFSAGRSWTDGGPKPLRGEHPPELYGFSNLWMQD